jgi:hypothetical protein
MPDIFTREPVTEPPPTNLEIFPEYAYRLCLFQKAVMIPGICSKPLFKWGFSLLEILNTVGILIEKRHGKFLVLDNYG